MVSQPNWVAVIIDGVSASISILAIPFYILIGLDKRKEEKRRTRELVMKRLKGTPEKELQGGNYD